MEENDKTKGAEEIMTEAWKRYERRKAREHRAKHVGGPRKEDYRRGDVRGEVKHMKRRLTKPEVKDLANKGIREICALGGFTKPAVEYVRKHRQNIKLFQRGKRLA